MQRIWIGGMLSVALALFSLAPALAQHGEAADAEAVPEMVETAPPVGAVSFIEYFCADPHALATFYATQFGWTIEAPDDYGMVFFSDPHGAMGAFSPQDPEFDYTGIILYMTVPDVAAALATAVELGGTVHLEPFALPDDWGTIATFFDPAGILVGLWSSQ